MSELKINELLSYALESGSSDLHLIVGSYPMVRINGQMKKLQLPIMDLDTMKSIRDEVLNEHQLKRFDEKLEIDFSVALEGKGRFRVNFFSCFWEQVARMLTLNAKILGVSILKG